MKQFDELGRLLKERWKQHSYAEEAFTGVAMDVLESRARHLAVTLEDVLRWAQSAELAPLQVEAEFGRPLTVFNDSRFYIDILTWVDGTTDIHEHGFSGAFKVLSGSSIHSRYQFVEQLRYNEHLRLGDVEHLGSELLHAGDLRPIFLGAKSAHCLFHLDRPTLSLVVRTKGGFGHRLQMSYLRSGIAYNPFHKDQDSSRILSSLRIMHDLEHPQVLERALALSDECDALTAFKIARLVASFTDRTRYTDFISASRSRHDELFQALRRGVMDEYRQHNITSRRALVHDRAHRFFLALLLNLRSGEDILRMVSERVPDALPADTVTRWIRELTAIPVKDSNALGAEIDDTALDIIRLLLIHGSEEIVIRELADRYEDVAAAHEEIVEFCASLRGSVLLGPLFQEAASSSKAQSGRSAHVDPHPGT